MTREQALTQIAKTLMEGKAINYANIAIKLMEHDPQLFAKLMRADIPVLPWVAEARRYFKSVEAVNCIKAIRNRPGNGFGLWEAKQIYDAWRNAGYWQCDDYRVTQEMKDALNTLQY